MRERSFTVGWSVDLPATVGPLLRGRGDPTHRFDGAGRFWWACTTADGPATLAVAARGPLVHATAWGPGADRLLAQVPALVGEGDDWSRLDVSAYPVLQQVRRGRPGMRLSASGHVMDALVPAILEQKVTGVEARRAWRSLVLRYGTPAPGDGEMAQRLRVPPTPDVLLEVPTWQWHRFGVDLHHQRAIRAAATVARRMEECLDMPLADAEARLRVLPGVGAWTAAEVLQRAAAHPDAVSVGDYHLKNMVVHLLTGRPRGTDEDMLELLAPWAGQRQRVMRLVELAGVVAPRYGPKFNYTDIRAI